MMIKRTGILHQITHTKINMTGLKARVPVQTKQRKQLRSIKKKIFLPKNHYPLSKYFIQTPYHVHIETPSTNTCVLHQQWNSFSSPSLLCHVFLSRGIRSSQAHVSGVTEILKVPYVWLPHFEPLCYCDIKRYRTSRNYRGYFYLRVPVSEYAGN